MLPTEAETPPGRNRKRRRDWKRVELLDLVCPLAIGALSGFDLLGSLLSQDADKATDRVRLPGSGFHDLGERRAFCALHQRDYLSLSARALGLPLGLCFLGAARLPCDLGFLGRLTLGLGLLGLRRR